MDLYLGKPPDDDAELLQWSLNAYRQMTGKEPTPEEIEGCRQLISDKGEARAANTPIRPEGSAKLADRKLRGLSDKGGHP